MLQKRCSGLSDAGTAGRRHYTAALTDFRASGFGPRRSGGFVCIFLAELVHATGSVHDLLLARKERMAL